MPDRHIYRIADGVRVEGKTRPVFTFDFGTYVLSELEIFADGRIDFGSRRLDLDGLRELLESGVIATTIEAGANGFVHHLAGWRFDEAHSLVDIEMLLGEVADEIDRLNDRPDSAERCRMAVDVFMAERTEANRAEIQRRYLEIPQHHRQYALSDIDSKDWPLRVLATPVGEPTPDPYDHEPVTAEMHETALRYFERRGAPLAARPVGLAADESETQRAIGVSVPMSSYPPDWYENPGVESLQIDSPTAVVVAGRRYPSVEHAFWALSTPDEEVRTAIAAVADVAEARRLAAAAPRQEHWDEVRQAVMMRLLWTKFRQHPRLAEYLLSTGDGPIDHTYVHASFWGNHGSNWIGRLHELVRAELALDRAALPLGGL